MTSLSARLRGVIALATVFTVLNVLSVAVLVLLRDDRALAPDTAWGRAIVILAAGLLLEFFAIAMALGSRRARIMVRVESVILLVSAIVLIAIPGFLPLWMKLEQGLCALALLGIVLLTVPALRGRIGLRRYAKMGR